MPILLLRIKFQPIDEFMRRAFLVCTRNNLDNELDNIREITFNNGFKVEHIKLLILNILNYKNSENKFNSQ